MDVIFHFVEKGVVTMIPPQPPPYDRSVLWEQNYDTSSNQSCTGYIYI